MPSAVPEFEGEPDLSSPEFCSFTQPSTNRAEPAQPGELLVVARLGLSTPEGGDDGAQQRAADGIRHYRGRVALSGG